MADMDVPDPAPPMGYDSDNDQWGPTQTHTDDVALDATQEPDPATQQPPTDATQQPATQQPPTTGTHDPTAPTAPNPAATDPAHTTAPANPDFGPSTTTTSPPKP